MSLLRTKPRWCSSAIPTDRGWVNPVSNELLVSFKNLKTLLDAEIMLNTPIVVEKVNEPEPVIVKEETVKRPGRKQKIIAEVVEYKLHAEKNIIGE
jgi:hypothetical protein